MLTDAPAKISGDELLAELLSTAPKGTEETKEAPEDEKDIDKIKQRKPPSRGLCRRCGSNKPINRLMLCYECWVKTVLEERGWKDGEPHPAWCNCDSAKGHTRRTNGN